MIDEPEDDDLEDPDWDGEITDDSQKTDDEATTDREETTDDEEMTDSSSSFSDEEPIHAEELLALQQDTLLANAALEQQKAAEAKAVEEEQAKRKAVLEDPRDESLLLYMRPWHVTLNSIGNHGTVLFLNTHNFTISQTCFGNICDFRHNAIPYLRNMINNFKTLKWIPGGLYSSDHDKERYTAYQDLYLEAGWPNAFDSEMFNSSRQNYETEHLERYIAQDPLRHLSEHVSRMRSRELSKIHYHNALEKLASLPSTADVDERKNLEQGIDRFEREFPIKRVCKKTSTKIIKFWKWLRKDFRPCMRSQCEHQDRESM